MRYQYTSPIFIFKYTDARLHTHQKDIAVAQLKYVAEALSTSSKDVAKATTRNTIASDSDEVSVQTNEVSFIYWRTSTHAPACKKEKKASFPSETKEEKPWFPSETKEEKGYFKNNGRNQKRKCKRVQLAPLGTQWLL